ncbi:MAG: hypothetical protein AAF198_10725 [Pseudomonadota bacterium]
MVSKFLQDCSSLEEVRFKKHGYFTGERNDRTIFFTTVRQPLSLYKSLFNYGCDGSGGLAKRLRRIGKKHLYKPNNEQFNMWLNFILTDGGFELGFPEFKEFAHLEIGMMSFRHFLMSVSKPLQRLRKCENFEDVKRIYESEFLHDCILQQENLKADLIDMSSEQFPQFFDQDKVASFWNNTSNDTVNASKSGRGLVLEMSEPLREVFVTQERLLISCLAKL